MDARGKHLYLLPGHKQCREQGQGLSISRELPWLGRALLAPEGPILVMGKG